MISCYCASEQGNLDLWRYINAFIIIIIIITFPSNSKKILKPIISIVRIHWIVFIHVIMHYISFFECV